MAGWYRQGTVALTPGSAAVAGAGTMWMGVVRPGSAFTTDGRTLYEIREVANDHTLTLDRPWEGGTAAASAYAVIAASATLSNAELASEIAAMVAKWAVREDQYDDWVGGSPNGGPGGDGKYPLTDSKGVTRLVESPARLLQLLDDGVVEHAAQIIAAIEDDVATARQAATAATAAMTAVGADRQAVGQAAATIAAQTGASTTAAATATAQAAIAAQRADEAAGSAATAAGLEASATAALSAVETARDIVLEARSEAGTAATGALSSRTAAEAARDTASASRDAALEARDAAVTARTQAQDWASKTDAPVSGSLKSALSYALDAASQATIATGKAMEAVGSAAAAAASAADLDAAATAAQAAAGDAGTGALTATAKAAAAAISADIARSAAQQAETAGAGSATARTAAEAARDSAATAMTAAQVAASQAGQSQTNAANSAQTAATAAVDAISAKSDATSARDLAVAARTEAQGARDLSQAFAQGAVGYQPSPGVYSAFHWSEQAKGHAQTAATIVGGSNFGIVGDGASQRFTADNPGSLLNLVQAPGGKLTFSPGNHAVSFGFDATTAPVVASGNITAGTVQGALEEIDHRLSTLSQDSIANGGGSVQVTEDGAVEIAPAAGRTATYKGGELHTSATAYGKAETDAAIAAMVTAGQAAGAAKLTTPRTIALSGGATGTATAFDGTQNIAIPVTAVAASALTGTIDIARLPAGALERLYPVASDAERFALTTAQVQKGDTVQVGGAGGLMYLVIDESNLGNAAGYRAYTAARASAVDWSGVESKPALLASLASLDSTAGVLTQTGAGTGAKRAIGTAASSDIPDRAAADGRYAQLGVANNFTTAPTVAGNSVWHAASHPTTVSGYGITDAYSRTETDSAISTAISTLSPNGIGQGDTSVTVTDSGSNGKITLKTDNAVKAEVTASGVDFKDQPTVNGQPLAGSSVTKSAVTVLPATGTINVPAKTILSVYSQFIGQAFNVDYNTEAQYTQENAATGTDNLSGQFQLYNTAGAQIDGATKLLIHADGVNGSTEIIDERGITPFGTHCGYFDGAGYWKVTSGYKTAFGTGDLTASCWARHDGFTSDAQSELFALQFTGGAYIRANYMSDGTARLQYANTYVSSATGAFPLTGMHHHALVRSAGTIKWYVDGVAVASVSDTTSYGGPVTLWIGCRHDTTCKFIGWIDQLHVSKTARWTANFTPSTIAETVDANSIHLFTFDDGHGGQVLKDRANSGHEIYIEGSAAISTGWSKFGTTSLYMPGSSRLNIDQTKPHADLNLGSDNFTIDLHARLTSMADAQVLFSIGGSNQIGLQVQTSGGNLLVWMSSNASGWDMINGLSLGSFTVNTAAHYAIVRSGSTVYLFKDGVLQNTANVGTAALTSLTRWCVGAYHPSVGGGNMNGYIDELRIKRGEAVWTSNFTVPTMPHIADERTILLCHFEGANGDKITLDSSGSSYGTNAFTDSVTPCGTMSVSLTASNTRAGHFTSLPGYFYYGGFPGNEATAANPYGHPLYFGTNTKLCIEGWFYFPSAPTDGLGVFSMLNYLIPAGSGSIYCRIYSGQPKLAINASEWVATGPAVTTGWNHIAVIRDGRGWYIYTNGVSGSAGSPAANVNYPGGGSELRLQIGTYDGGTGTIAGFGAVDSFRITNGHPRYTANFTPATLVSDDMTTLMWEFNGAVGQRWVKELSQNTTLVVANGNARTVKDGAYLTPVMTNSANLAMSVIRSKFGVASLAGFSGSGTGSKLYTPNASWMSGAGNTITFDAWVYLTGSQTNIFAQKTNGSDETWQIWGSSGDDRVMLRVKGVSGAQYSFNSNVILSQNTWTHVAVVFGGGGNGSHVFYINGVATNSASWSEPMRTDSAGMLYVATDMNGTSFLGNVDEMRLSNTARWTTNFTPPTIAYGQQYAAGPFYVATLNSGRIDVSDWSTIHSATITQSTPPGTSVKWLVSFDGRATWRKWDGSAWVVVPLNNGSSIDTNGNDYLTMQNALTNLNVEAYSTIDFAFSLKTANPNFSPSVDAVTLARDEYELGAAKTDYTIKRNGAAGAEVHRITNLKAYPVNVVYDYVA